MRQGSAETHRRYQQKWREENREKVSRYARRGHLRRKYGLTEEGFSQLVIAQDSKCAICREDFGDQTPVVDHDHTCCPTKTSCGDCIRGLLCSYCNRGLGFFFDNAETIQLASEYLAREGKRSHE